MELAPVWASCITMMLGSHHWPFNSKQNIPLSEVFPKSLKTLFIILVRNILSYIILLSSIYNFKHVFIYFACISQKKQRHMSFPASWILKYIHNVENIIQMFKKILEITSKLWFVVKWLWVFQRLLGNCFLEIWMLSYDSDVMVGHVRHKLARRPNCGPYGDPTLFPLIRRPGVPRC